MKLHTLLLRYLLSLGIPSIVAEGMTQAAITEYERYQNKRDYYGRRKDGK